MLLVSMVVFVVIVVLPLAFVVGSGHILTRRRAPDSPTEPSMPYEAVSFPSRYKATLHGWWIPAPGEAKGTVIFCHGQNGSMEGDLPQAEPLHTAGFNVLLFNFRAHGTSNGDRITYGVFEKEDLLGAIDYLNATYDVDQVAVIGFSMGAAVAMIAAALTPKIAVIVVDGIFLRFADVIARWYRVPLAGILAQGTILGATLLTDTRMFQVSPKLWARHLDHTPVLFIHGENDHLVSLQDVQALAADLQTPYEIWVAPDSDHREAFRKHPQIYNQRVLDWLAKYL